MQLSRAIGVFAEAIRAKDVAPTPQTNSAAIALARYPPSPNRCVATAPAAAETAAKKTPKSEMYFAALATDGEPDAPRVNHPRLLNPSPKIDRGFAWILFVRRRQPAWRQSGTSSRSLARGRSLRAR